MDDTELEIQYFQRGKELLGKNAGGLLAMLLKSKNGNVALARAELERASTKEAPREWLARITRPKGSGHVGNGAAAEWERKAAAQIADRRHFDAKAPSLEDKARVADIHSQFRRRPIAPDPLDRRDDF